MSAASATNRFTRRRQTIMDDHDLAIETQAYQVFLEGHRADPHNEDLYEDMLKAKAAMEVAWLKQLNGRAAYRTH
jgi:acyl-ACP thioesterase